MLMISVAVRDIPGQPDLWANISNFMDPAKVLIQLTDPHSFAAGALDIFNFGWIRTENKWLIKLWPPGFMLTEGWVLRLFGIDAPFILILMVLNCALAAVLLLLIRKNLSAGVAKQYAGLFPLLPFFFPMPRVFLLEPAGIMLGECFAIIFFLMAMSLMVLAVRVRSWRCTVASGLMLALSAYFRSQFELIIVALTVFAVLPLLLFAVRILFWSGLERVQRDDQSWLALTVTLALLVCHLSMMPWRVANYLDPDIANLSWVQTSQLVYYNAGRTDQQLLDAGGGWLVQGGGNLACVLDSSYCGKTDKYAFYRAFFQNMDQWYTAKMEKIGGYWFASVGDFASHGQKPTLLETAMNVFFLACVLATFPLLLRVRRHREAGLHWWFCISFYSCFFAVFTFVHFEVRYFYAVKIFSVFSVLLLSGMAWQSRAGSRLPANNAVTPG